MALSLQVPKGLFKSNKMIMFSSTFILCWVFYKFFSSNRYHRDKNSATLNKDKSYLFNNKIQISKCYN
jgi:hypothetical protein